MYDELVKSLRELCEMTALCDDYICFECPYEEKCGSYKNQRLSAVYRQAADAIEEMQGKYFLMKKTAEWLAEKVPRWIPVSERLPMSGVPTLICGDGNVVELGFFDDEHGYWYDGRGYRTFVHHWMPLPGPPEEGK